MRDDLISRQAAIEYFMTNTNWYDEDGYEIHDAEDKRALLKSYFDGIPPAQPEQRWIPCKERTPEDENKRYWICTDTGYQCQCRWTNINHIWPELTGDWHWHIMDIPQYTHVVAWRELPEPYREEKDANGT